MKKTLFALACLTNLVWADGPKLPPPSSLLDSKAVSLGVVHARPDDTGFKELFKTAWGAVQKRPGGTGGVIDMIGGFLSRTAQENMLLGFLPFQMVRIDHFDEKGRDRASFMVTLSGWPGLQGLFFATLLNGPDGQPYPTERVGNETVVIRARPGQPKEDAGVVARLGGTFYSFADIEIARRILEKKQGNNPDLSAILSALNQEMDTYGVLLNKQDSLMRFLEWVNKRDFEAAKTSVGAEKLTNLFKHVELVTWQGDLISDDRMDMQVRFRTDSPDQAEVMEEVLSTVRKTLAERGRTGDLQMTTVDNDVMLDIQFTGYRKMLTDYLER
ncbi:hypothetical protein IV102_07600 [bacterium]|nr:hypothetical protein [bacterium]